MSSYFQQDMLTFDDGELNLDSGDIGLAGVRQSQRQLIINFLQTTRGSWRFMPLFGWGGELYMGRPNFPLTHQIMAEDIKVGIEFLDDLDGMDVDYTVTLLDKFRDSAAIVMNHRGVFVEPDGTLHSDNLLLAWEYSYRTGRIETEA